MEKDWQILEFETENPIRQNSPPKDYLYSLSTWHIDQVKIWKKSFPKLFVFFESEGISNSLRSVSIRDIEHYWNELTSLEVKLIEHELKILSNWPAFTPVGIKIKKTIKTKQDIQEYFENLVEKDADLITHLKKSIENIKPERDKKILQLRLGLTGEKPMTLEAVAKEVNKEAGGITRERVRQIELKRLGKIENSQLWDDLFRTKISKIIKKKGEMVFVNELEELDPWFHKFNLEYTAWHVFLKHFAQEFIVTKIAGIIVLTYCEKEEAIQKLIKFVSSKIRNDGKGIKEILEEANNYSDVYLDVTEDFINQVSTLVKTQAPTLNAMVVNYIKSSDREVSLDGFLKYAIKNNYKIEKQHYRSAENAISKKTVCVSRRPTLFATINTIGVEKITIQNFCNEFYRYWLQNFDIDREFHADEITEWANLNGFDLAVKDSGWRSVGLLSFDNMHRFKSNKLRVWLYEYWQEKQPPNLDEIVEELLKKSGRPLRTTEIKKSIYKKRGTGNTFQLHEKNGIMKHSSGGWVYRWLDTN